jgi:hypothetical protein
MKKSVFLTLIIFCIFMQGNAQNKWTFGYQPSVILKQVYNPILTQFLKENSKTAQSKNTQFYIDRAIKLTEKHTIGFGLNVQLRELRLNKYMDSLEKYCNCPQPEINNTLEYRPVDNVSTIPSTGLNINYEYTFKQMKKIDFRFGGIFTQYFVNNPNENSKLTLPEKKQDYNKTISSYKYINGPTSVLLNGNYSANLQVYGKLAFKLHAKHSFALRLSLGTSLYSNWNNFSKYLWLGTGLEYSFGKFKEKVKKVE